MNAKTPRRQGRRVSGQQSAVGSRRARSADCGLLTVDVRPWRLGVLAFILYVSATASASAADTSDDYLLHLPGISGYHWLDRGMIEGLRLGGYAGTIDVVDWPRGNPGLGALLARERNHDEAKQVAQKLERQSRDHPGGRIVLTAHSGGTGILIWALEDLPDDVQVDTVLLIAPALSPTYDLSKALRHVRGKAYSFFSPLDAIVLGVGTRTFGTIDGVKVDAAGKLGFTAPDGADAEQYRKLVQVPYDVSWMPLGNIGDHIGPMARPFAEAMLSPLAMGKALPVFKRPTTQPAEKPEARNPKSETKSQISNSKSRSSNPQSKIRNPQSP